MAEPIAFKPKQADPRTELQLRLEAAPNEHAEALLVAYDLLEAAHRQGLLDALRGAVAAKDTITELIAQYSQEPVSVNLLRHVLAVGKMIGSLDPEPISKLSKEAAAAIETHRREEKPPSVWQLFKRIMQPDTRRGLSFLTLMLGALGRAVR
jgi:uncharacterized protein YjgD (DUF1641 family)